MLNYQRALALRPGHPEAAANLAYVRRTLNLTPPPASAWNQVVGWAEAKADPCNCSKSATARCSFWMANDNRARPDQDSFDSLSAPFSSSSRTTASCLHPAARSNGVWPALLLYPLSNSSRTTARCPRSTAFDNGVWPGVSVDLASAPSSSSSRTTDSCPRRAAHHNGVRRRCAHFGWPSTTAFGLSYLSTPSWRHFRAVAVPPPRTHFRRPKIMVSGPDYPSTRSRQPS